MEIKSITPIDFFELAIAFSNGELKVFAPGKLKLYDQYNFLAYPNKLRAFTFTPRTITWFNGLSFGSDFIYDNSDEIAMELLVKKSVTIGFENQAPTKQHTTHHVYSFSIYPFKLEKQFVLGESIGGGHAEMGGCAFYSLNELIETPDYATHLKLANCSWVVEILTANGSDWKSVLNDIIVEVCKRASDIKAINGQ
ncbi:MAG: hypothetical protein EAS52_16815 [Parapedobacter sp.]|nr:MAG: hypothetical protein EAS52_16815 [Parapedobacter sp.]